ncbi:phage Gp37/Gp68 family protein [Xanthomonas translucens]|uniref:phage Gp37/Gp68 family protein n=1 Tax=Xanthomonas campestris pv. translucens TaxID=343 RepID=UPI00071E87A8|nr:phage Gp37/Gp68 family protein [Xanthomonas translucens]WLA02758.1 phage Gp37/Gp68 family protein [Xanthomonas translucens]
MSQTTAIEWCDSTFNPWIGCTKISPACDHCYAAVSTAARAFGIAWGAGQPRRRTTAANWKLPLRWNARPFYACRACGWRGDQPSTAGTALTDGLPSCPACDALDMIPARRRVFCASLADVFDNEIDPQWRDDLFDLIGATPNLDWLLLTKRIGNVGNMLPVPFDFDRLYPHVWIGATICNQAEAERDIPKLLRLEARVRFLSIEPLLGPVDIEYPEGLFPGGPPRCCSGASNECGCMGQPTEPPLLYGLDWVIAGGESGHGARPVNPTWVRMLRDQCAAWRVPFLFKQWGEWAPHEVKAGGDLGGDLRRGVVRHLHGPGNPEGHFRQGDAYVRRVGKKLAGRLLDGKQHDQFPEAR